MERLRTAATSGRSDRIEIYRRALFGFTKLNVRRQHLAFDAWRRRRHRQICRSHLVRVKWDGTLSTVVYRTLPPPIVHIFPFAVSMSFRRLRVRHSPIRRIIKMWSVSLSLSHQRPSYVVRTPARLKSAVRDPDHDVPFAAPDRPLGFNKQTMAVQKREPIGGRGSAEMQASRAAERRGGGRKRMLTPTRSSEFYGGRRTYALQTTASNTETVTCDRSATRAYIDDSAAIDNKTIISGNMRCVVSKKRKRKKQEEQHSHLLSSRS